MATTADLSELLGKLKTSLESAAPVLPDADAILPPADSISLLDTKSELFLSYLQNLVFLILLKIRQHSSATPDDEDEELFNATVKRLVELRVYLDKGVRPLEARLRYQIDKVLRAADDATRNAAQQSRSAKASARRRPSDASTDASAADSDALDDLAYRPNPAAFARPAQTARRTGSAPPAKDGTTEAYRPPRITPASLPTTDSSVREAGARRPVRSAAVDDYIASEMSGAPAAEPSIGSTIRGGGRSTKSAKEQAVDEERRAYEESNFIRLPAVGRKERAKQRKGQGGGEMDLLGGLGGVGDRVAKATQKRSRDDLQRGDGLAQGTVMKGGKRRKFGR